MRLDIKLAIVQSGQPQYAIAQQIGIPESRLSKFIHGYGTLRREQVEKLHALLGLTKADEHLKQTRTRA
jgi:plasmid maintenance system antidote protein VapI